MIEARQGGSSSKDYGPSLLSSRYLAIVRTNNLTGPNGCRPRGLRPFLRFSVGSQGLAPRLPDAARSGLGRG